MLITCHGSPQIGATSESAKRFPEARFWVVSRDLRRSHDIKRRRVQSVLGSASIDTRDESSRARTVLAIRRTKSLLEDGLLGAGSQIAPNRHEPKRGPHDRRGHPECAAERQQGQSHVDRVPQDSEWTTGGELMTLVNCRAETPRAKIDERRDHQCGACSDD